MKGFRLVLGNRCDVRQRMILILGLIPSTLIIGCIALFVSWQWIFLLLATGLATYLVYISQWDVFNPYEDVDFWKVGPKRKFRFYEGLNKRGKSITYVETLYIWHWIPLFTVKKTPLKITYNYKTGEPKPQVYSKDICYLKFDSVMEAQEYLHKERGISAAIPAGEIEI